MIDTPWRRKTTTCSAQRGLKRELPCPRNSSTCSGTSWHPDHIDLFFSLFRAYVRSFDKSVWYPFGISWNSIFRWASVQTCKSVHFSVPFRRDLYHPTSSRNRGYRVNSTWLYIGRIELQFSTVSITGQWKYVVLYAFSLHYNVRAIHLSYSCGPLCCSSFFKGWLNCWLYIGSPC